MAVSSSESVIAALTIRNNLPHSQTLFSQISTLLELAGVKIEEVNVFAAGVGPGSFTGLRVGLAAIKGFADSLNRPCLGVDSMDLHALASGIDGAHLVILSVGRGEVYCGFREVASGNIVDSPSICDRVGEPLSVLQAASEYLRRSPLIVVGEGYKHKEEINQLRSDTGTEPIFLKSDLNISSVLARRAALLMKENRTSPATPNYIRKSDAEIEWGRRRR